MDVVSFFAGCGGLDLGFEQAGFHSVWANEFEPSAHVTYKKNHPDTILCKEDINTVVPKDVPDCDGFIGGHPCQSWSVAGKQQGLDDMREQLFLTYIDKTTASVFRTGQLSMRNLINQYHNSDQIPTTLT